MHNNDSPTGNTNKEYKTTVTTQVILTLISASSKTTKTINRAKDN